VHAGHLGSCGRRGRGRGERVHLKSAPELGLRNLQDRQLQFGARAGGAGDRIAGREWTLAAEVAALGAEVSAPKRGTCADRKNCDRWTSGLWLQSRLSAVESAVNAGLNNFI
jgi:hypothetical protein